MNDGQFKKIIIGVLVASVVLGVLFWKFSPLIFNRSTTKSGPITLNIWGLWEDSKVIQPLIDSYEKNNPNVKINYTYQSSLNYRSRVQFAIGPNHGADTPPDIIMIHDTWLPVFNQSNLLSSVPSNIMNVNDYQNTFYPVAKDMLTDGTKIYAIPIEIDGLAMYYNEDILKGANVSVPQDWFTFINVATKLTVPDAQGHIKTAGAALGATGNVDNWPDIVGLLFAQQPGADLKAPNNDYGVQVIKFYTSFITDPKHKTWDVNLEHSTQAFEEGKLAFYFAPSWRASELRVANPNLNFKVAPVPQLPGNPPVTWGTFWAFSVPNSSPNQSAAWQFLKYLSSADSEKTLYKNEAATRLIGEPYSRRDLGQDLSGDPIAGAFVNQASTYKSWYLSSGTFDTGINDNIIKYYEDAVNSVLQGGDPTTAADTATKGVNQVLGQYGLVPVSSAAPGQ